MSPPSTARLGRRSSLRFPAQSTIKPAQLSLLDAASSASGSYGQIACRPLILHRQGGCDVEDQTAHATI